MKYLHRILFFLGLSLAGHAQAALVYNSWTTQTGPAQGNYIFTVNHVGSQFSYNLTINPWNAEALGLFIDLGNVSMPANIGLVSTDADDGSTDLGHHVDQVTRDVGVIGVLVKARMEKPVRPPKQADDYKHERGDQEPAAPARL